MTDEEMAEEYADRTRIVDENTRVGTDCISLVQDYEGNIIDIHERIKQAYLAGLKAGRSQWHDLRKDPDDLPRQGVELLVSVDGYTRTAMYSKETNSFTCQEGVIAWMYEPEFI